MKKEFLVERQGKTFCLYAGLLALGHENGLKSIRTELIQVPSEANRGVAICTATVVLEKDGVERTFTGIGDAAVNNVAPAMQTCLVRMAETRSKARALRDAVNIGVAALEELGEEDAHDGAPERGYSVPTGRSSRTERYPASNRTGNGAVNARTAPSKPATGTSIPAELRNPIATAITEAQSRAIRSLCRPRNLDADVVAQEKFAVENLAALNEAQAGELIRSLTDRANGRAAATVA